MARIVRITQTPDERTFEVCLAEKCMEEPAEEHLGMYHRSWSWSLTDSPVSEEDMLREVRLLAAEEKARLTHATPSARSVSIEV